MIDIPFIESIRYHKNQDKCKGDDTPCIVCGKPVKNIKHMLHIWDGYSAVKQAEIDDLDPAGDTGMYPIGKTCLRNNPELKEYVFLY